MRLIQILKKNYIALKRISSNLTRFNPDKVVIGQHWTLVIIGLMDLEALSILNGSVIL